MQFEDNPCVVCGPDNPIGLHAEWRREEAGMASATVSVPEAFQGFRGMVHGGVVAALLDDAMWHAIWSGTNVSTYTVDLKTRYRHPTHVGSPLEVRGRFLDSRHRVFRAEATVSDAASGEILAEAEGRFMADPTRR